MNNAFNARFEELQLRFLERIAREYPMLSGMYAKMNEMHGDSASITAFRTMIHQYCGNGSTFGFPAISDAARRLENKLNGISSGEKNFRPTEEIHVLVNELTAALRQALETRRAAGDPI